MFHALKAGALDEVLQQLRLLTDLAPGAVIEPSHTAWQMLIDHRCEAHFPFRIMHWRHC